MGEKTETTDAESTGSTKKSSRPAVAVSAAKLRTLLARVVWAVCVLCALVLASAVLMVALDANRANDLVTFVSDLATKVDLGFFDLSNPIKDFDTSLPEGEDTKTALFNYGLAAIVWLVLGRIADRVIRP